MPAKKFHADEIVKYRDIITKAGIAKIELGAGRNLSVTIAY